MSAAARLAAFGAGLAVVFAAALGAGNVVGGADADVAGENAQGDRRVAADAPDDKPPAPYDDVHDEAAAAEVTGLSVSADGYTLRPEQTRLRTGTQQFGLQVIGPDGEPVRDYTPTHTKDLHLVVVRRDGSGFQHLHPEQDADGRWRTPLTLAEPGPYRVFADFAPEGEKPRALGVDAVVPGPYEPAPVQPSRTWEQDGYQVEMDGELEAGKDLTLTFRVNQQGRPVADLEPYLGAYGHLVALREGDLAYLHVHPEEGTAGPELRFRTTVPSAGTYRLYLDTQHGDKVRTATFTAATEGTASAGDSAARTGEHEEEAAHEHDGS